MLLVFNYCDYCCCNVALEIFPWSSTFNILIKIELFSLQILPRTPTPFQTHGLCLIIVVKHTQTHMHKYVNKTL